MKKINNKASKQKNVNGIIQLISLTNFITLVLIYLFLLYNLK